MKRITSRSVIVVAILAGILSLGTVFAEEKEITISIWNVFNPAVSKDAKAMEEVFKKYEELHPNIKIRHEIMTYADLHDKIVVAGVAGSGPDQVHMLGEWLPEFIRIGLIEDMTKYLKEWEDWQQFPKACRKVATLEGRVWVIPSIASSRVLLYREDLLEKTGLRHPPRTWNESKEMSQKIAAANPGIHGFAFCSATTAMRGPQEFLPFLWQTDARLVKKIDEKWEIGFTVDQAKEVFEFYYDLMHTYHACTSEIIGWEYLELDQAWEFGTVAMSHNGNWMSMRALRAETGKFWRGAPLPKNKNRATYFEVKLEGLGKFSKHKEETAEFMKWLYSKENMATFTKYDNLPSRIDVMQMPFYQNQTIWVKPFLEVVPDGLPYPPIPIAEMNKAMMEGIQEVLYKRKTPERAAVDFKDKINYILETVVNK